jgi:hypothetical protein
MFVDEHPSDRRLIRNITTYNPNPIATKRALQPPVQQVIQLSPIPSLVIPL